ncbi:MAG: hypothetical protein ABL984_11340 [Pyrinomonadaceae bacterium]
MTLKELAQGGSHSYDLLRGLAHRVCGAHYETPQYNQRLLICWLNHLSGLGITVESGTYSAPHHQLNFQTADGTVSFSTDGTIEKDEFLAAFTT